MNLLFEVSWEVCNKVGGIYTVIRSKAPYVSNKFRNGYFVLGPQMDENPEFKETDEPEYERIRPALQRKKLKCKLGRWKIESEPRAIIVDYRDTFDISKLLYDYWRDFGVDSYGAGEDYIEPVLFSTACASVIGVLHDELCEPGSPALAHFHKWTMGAGLLHLKKHKPEIGLIFTAHATSLGRAMASRQRNFYDELRSINPIEEAAAYGVAPKHSLESATARETDVFTTVSEVTAVESASLIGKTPDLVIKNGLNISEIPDHASSPERHGQSREFLLNFSRKFLQKELSPQTRFWVTAGRYELHNKGYDVFLESLAAFEKEYSKIADAPDIVALLLIAAGHKGVHGPAHRRIHSTEAAPEDGVIGIATHRLQDEHNDAIIKTCNRLHLRNTPETKVHVIFAPAYLDGYDGIFEKPYEEILDGCDLGVFPSFYDPWGYTPLECMAHSVPAITSDLSGYGQWIRDTFPGGEAGVSIIERKGKRFSEVVDALTQQLFYFAQLPEAEIEKLRRQARQSAAAADWSNFFQGYEIAYQQALVAANRRIESSASQEAFVTFSDTHHSETPRYRAFSVVSKEPKKIKGLLDLAYNLWWTWTPDAREMFAHLDQQLWIETDHNPIKLLNRVPDEVLIEKFNDKDFLKLYNSVLKSFQSYMDDTNCKVDTKGIISQKNPVAYFSMEYGMHECLPVYSGGLGVLSGDHLKSASDLNIPLFGVGLFYHQGYFVQSIDLTGYQREHMPFHDFAELPVTSLFADDGSEAIISVELPGRTLYARVWTVQVGRVKLYLLDSNIDRNSPEDRAITSQLYGGDRRMRLNQEILLGIGGTKLVRDILKLDPAVFHLNEGHVGFLLLERIKDFMKQGLTFQEARDAVRSTSVFTTHTPVPAGNEAFPHDLLNHGMRHYIDHLGISWEQFLELGRETPHQAEDVFSMTVLALKLSNRSNGVSKLHGKVAQEMWQQIWKGVNIEEIPIFPITNGIHLATWVSKPMRNLFDKYLSLIWGENEDDITVWEKIDNIPDKELWQIHLQQKTRMLQRIKKKTSVDYTRRGEHPDLIRETLERLNPDVLTIGFARRLAAYKRSNLFLRNIERIKRILTNPARPVQILIAGKAHPQDQQGKEILKQIVDVSRWPEFRGRILVIEDYNMGVGRMLTRGVDVWLNNPLRPYEASGTSGMKVGPNGGINLSIPDGWWDEAYEPDMGWAIQTQTEFVNREHQDDFDNMSLMDVLEQEVVPLYYDRNSDGIPKGWVEMMKKSIIKTSSKFNTCRMLKQYHHESYQPTAERRELLFAKNFQPLKELTLWKQRIHSRFATLQIRKVTIKGIQGDIVEAGGAIEVWVLLHPGQLTAEEIQPEFVFGLRKDNSFSSAPEILPLRYVGEEDGSGLLQYKLSHTIEKSGSYLYGVRVIPYHRLLSKDIQETGLMCWG